MVEVDELRRGLADVGASIRVDATVAREVVDVRARHRRTTHRSAVIVAIAVALATVAVVAVASWPTSTRRPFISTGPASGWIALGGLPAVPTEVFFSDPEHGVGLTSHCVVLENADPVCDLGVLATTNGGYTWILVGARRHVVYLGWRGYPFIHLAAQSREVWIYGTRTFESTDGARTFKDVNAPGQVVALTPGRRDVWAAVRDCPADANGTLPVASQHCPALLVAAPLNGGAWRALGPVPSVNDPYVALQRPSDDVAYLLTQDAPHVLLRSSDGGRTWRGRNLPEAASGPVLLDSRGSNDLWVIAGSASPGVNQDKALYRSRDSGVHWTLIATTAQPTPPGVGRLPRPGSVVNLRVVTPNRLWLTVFNGSFIGSIDGGHRWFDSGIRGVYGPGNGVLRVDFVDPHHGWANGAGTLYRTVDGMHWAAVNSGGGDG